MDPHGIVFERLPWLDGYHVGFSCLKGGITLMPTGAWRDPPPHSGYSGLKKTFRRMVHHNDFFGASVFLTRKCNLGCEYCYERGHFQNRSLSARTCTGIVAWITQECRHSKPRHLDLFLYGGEPLLNDGMARRLLLSLSSFCTTAGIGFSSDMNTNGILLTPELARSLADAGLGNITVTLDGPPDVQNKRRGGSENDFWKILGTLRSVSRLIPLSIRSNIDSSNFKRVGELLEILYQRRLLGMLSYKAVVMGECNLPRCSPDHVGWKASGKSEDDMFQEVAHHLADLTLAYGLPPMVTLKSFVGETCNNMAARSFTFDVDGSIYRSSCAAVSRYEPHRLGTVDSPGLREGARQVFEEAVWEHCFSEKCPYLPVCQGGCQANRFLNHLEKRPPYCPKTEFRRGLRAYLTYMLRLARARGTFERHIWREG